MSNDSTGVSERALTSILRSRDPPTVIHAISQSPEVRRVVADTPTKPFFGAGGPMLRQFDEHHAGLSRKPSMESPKAGPPPSVVGIGGKGVDSTET
jgi:hypothetical protein